MRVHVSKPLYSNVHCAFALAVAVPVHVVVVVGRWGMLLGHERLPKEPVHNDSPNTWARKTIVRLDSTSGHNEAEPDNYSSCRSVVPLEKQSIPWMQSSRASKHPLWFLTMLRRWWWRKWTGNNTVSARWWQKLVVSLLLQLLWWWWCIVCGTRVSGPPLVVVE